MKHICWMREGRRLPCSWSLPLQASAFKFLPEIRRCHSQQVPLQHRMLREAEFLNSGGLNLTVGHCGSVWCFKGILGAANRNWRGKLIKPIKPVIAWFFSCHFKETKYGGRGQMSKHLYSVKMSQVWAGFSRMCNRRIYKLSLQETYSWNTRLCHD